jgi:hypothetical protein
MHRDTRIAIVGAGAAGLTAAYALRKAGFTNVAVFEKECRVGGKCRSVELQGRSYELGAVFHLRSAEPIAGMIREFGIDTTYGAVRPPPRWSLSPLFDLKNRRHFQYPRIPQTLAAAARCLLLSLRRPELRRAGHRDMPEDLAVPFSDWLRANRLEALELMFACWLSGFGYGYTTGIPAAYALKVCTPRVVRPFFLHDSRGFPHGFQGLWERVASVLDVRLNTSIERIERGEGVRIKTTAGDFDFDKLILSCDLRDIASTLDRDEEEAALIARIRHRRFHAVIAEAERMPARLAFLPAHFSEESEGDLVCWYQGWVEGNLFNFYAIATERMSEAEVHSRIAEDVRRVGGNLICIAASRNWNYFPSVSVEDLRGGFYRRLEGRQGFRHTYYAGEIMNFPSVDLVAEYSEGLVRTYFV